MRILRLNNDLCELAQIGDSYEDRCAEIGYSSAVVAPLGRTLRVVMANDFFRTHEESSINHPASQVFLHKGGKFIIYGCAFLCSIDEHKGILCDLTDEDYETAAKVLRSYGYVKGD